MKPRYCPNCNECNKHDSQFCSKCKMILSYNSYKETLEKEKEKYEEINKMKLQLNIIQGQMKSLLTTLTNIKDQDQLNKTSKFLFDSGIIS